MLVLTFKALHGLAPSYITEMLQPYKPSRSLRYACNRLLTVPSAKLKKYGCSSFSLAAPTIWNSLPEPIRNHHDISKFKTSITGQQQQQQHQKLYLHDHKGITVLQKLLV